MADILLTHEITNPGDASITLSNRIGMAVCVVHAHYSNSDEVTHWTLHNPDNNGFILSDPMGHWKMSLEFSSFRAAELYVMAWLLELEAAGYI